MNTRPGEYDELTRRHKELTTLYAIAEAINRPLDLHSMLEDSLDRVIEVTGADGGAIRLVDQSTAELVLAAHRGLSETYVQEATRFPLSQEIVGYVAREGKASLSKDMWEDERVSPEVRLLLKEVGHRSLAQVPLSAQERVVGTLGLTAKEPGFFDEDDLRLLNAIGQQIGVAIANAQLFEETQRKARKLAALNVVASVINQPLPLQEIMDLAIAKVIEVMETEAGGIRLLDQETGELPIVSSRGLSPEHIEEVKCRRVGEGIVGEVAQSGKPQVVKDVSRDPRVLSPSVMEKGGFNTFAVVPLRAKDVIVGTLGVITRRHRDFTPEDMDLLAALGDQIGVAVENSRLYTNLARRARELEAVHAIAATVNRPGELNRILEEGLKQTLAVTGLEMGVIGLRNMQDDSLILGCHHGMDEEFLALIKSRLSQKAFGPLSPEEADIQVTKFPPGAPDTPPHLKDKGIHLVANVPMFAEGEFVGVLNLATSRTQPFTAEERSLLLAIGHQLGTAIANAQLRQEALEAERLAAVGRVAASVAHDLRSPLGGILRSAEFLARPEISQETRHKLSRAIVSLARRLISTSQGILDYIQGERLSLRLAPTDLRDFLDEVLDVLQVDFSDRGIEVVRDYHGDGSVVMDADRMAQVIYNIAENARDAMQRGGKFIVTAQMTAGQVVLRFTDTGQGVPAELRERIFEPFFTYGKYQGAGLGLAIARQIVEEHGGTIHLESKEGSGSTFVVTLPV